MTEETTPTFDLREVLAGIQRAEDSTTVYFNEALALELSKTNKQLTRLSTRAAGGDQKAAEDFNKLDDAFEALRAKLRDQGYVVHFRSIPKRMKEDIQSRGLAKYPFKRDVYGRDDEQQAFDRQRYMRTEIFAAFVTKIVAPSGAVQIVDNGDEGRAVMDAFCAQAPDGEIEKLDAAIGEISGKTDTDTLAQQDTDFLS